MKNHAELIYLHLNRKIKKARDVNKAKEIKAVAKKQKKTNYELVVLKQESLGRNCFFWFRYSMLNNCNAFGFLCCLLIQILAFVSIDLGLANNPSSAFTLSSHRPCTCSIIYLLHRNP
nr:11 of first 40 amino acids of LRO (lysine-rich open reading frame) are lysine; complementary and partially overlaps EUO; putative [Chlamydia psittaci 6BC]